MSGTKFWAKDRVLVQLYKLRHTWPFLLFLSKSLSNNLKRWFSNVQIILIRIWRYIEPWSIKVEGTGVETLVGIFDLAPLAVFRPLAFPIFTLAEGLEVAMIELLQRTSSVNVFTRNFCSCVWFTSKLLVLPSTRDPIGNQSLHFFQLSRVDSNRIFHDTPMCCVTSRPWGIRSIARWDRTCLSGE